MDSGHADDVPGILTASSWKAHPDWYGYIHLLTFEENGRVETRFGDSDQGEVRIARIYWRTEPNGTVLLLNHAGHIHERGRITPGRFEFDLPYGPKGVFLFRLDFEPHPKPQATIGPFFGGLVGAPPLRPPAPNVPAKLEFYRGNGMFGGESIRWENGKLVWLRFGHNGAGSRDTREEAVPPHDAWREFWLSLDTLGTWSWAPSYPTVRNVADGDIWSVSLAHRDQRIDTRSYNGSPPHSADFEEAVKELFVAARRVDHEWEPDQLDVQLPAGPTGSLHYRWEPTRVAISWVNLEPRQPDGAHRTDPSHPTPRLQPGTLEVMTWTGGNSRPHVLELRPSPEAWARFWVRMDGEDLWDGLGLADLPAHVERRDWTVSLWRGAQRLNLKGTGNGSAAVDVLRRALEELVGATAPEL